MNKAANAPTQLHSRKERFAAGKALRATLPRERHAEWKPPARGRDPIEALQASNRHRLQELVPIRYGRMLRSPFTFMRGSAGLMARDLSTTPSTGLRVQACGDCHLLNFGTFATPERNLVFDMTDFDETLPAPWEWDLKRLAASFVVAARDDRRSDAEAKNAALACVRAYREQMRACSEMTPLAVWYERLDLQELMDQAPAAKLRKMAARPGALLSPHLFPRTTRDKGGRLRMVDQPPVLFHVADKRVEATFRKSIDEFRLSLSDDRRVLFDRYRLDDVALKVVGIGSVGMRCWVGLFVSEDGSPLFLQFKEATTSVLAPHAGASIYSNQGQRIVMGQRLMQSASDIFLGWIHGRRGRQFFGRQLRDMKFSMPVEGASPGQLRRYAAVCGEVLARAHARSGDAAMISGYLGKSDVFDRAIAKFAAAYADQTERDHASLAAAAKSGRIQAMTEEAL